MEMNYSHLKKWIKRNPRVVNFNRFCLKTDFKVQHIDYYVRHNKPMPEEMVDSICRTYNFSEEQKNEFFYLVRGYKK